MVWLRHQPNTRPGQQAAGDYCDATAVRGRTDVRSSFLWRNCVLLFCVRSPLRRKKVFTAYVRTKAGKITLCAMPRKWGDVEETAANMSKVPDVERSALLLTAGLLRRSRTVMPFALRDSIHVGGTTGGFARCRLRSCTAGTSRALAAHG